MSVFRLILSAAVSFSAVSSFAFELGRTDSVIYAADGHRDVAEELSGYLNRVFGRNFPVEKMPETSVPAAGLFVGVRPPRCDVTWDPARECCVRIVESDRVWLFGNDGELLHGTDDAVYDFLERFAGVRWLWPGDLGTVADPSAPVTVPCGKHVYVTPFRKRLTDSFGYPFGRSPDEARDLRAWLRHRHVGSSLAAKGSGFHHAFDLILPREKYGREHPEYYALVPPERWIGEPKPTVPSRLNDPLTPGPWQVCTSNPDVRRLFAENLLASGTDAIQSISPNDGYGFCECSACRAQDPEGRGIGKDVYDVTDRMFDFLSDVAWRVYGKSPTSKVGLFSYSYYDKVPVRKVKLPPNVYLSCCYIVYGMNARQEAELAGKLSGLAATGAKIIGREYWGTHYTMRYPLSHSRKIDRNLKLLHRLGAAGIYGEPGNDFAVRASDLYLLTLLAWDPTADRAAALADFCGKAFGRKAGEVMFRLFESIEDRVEEKVEGFHRNHGAVFRHYTNEYAEFNRFMTTVFDGDFSDMCEKETERAEKLADTPERRRRVAYIASGLAFARRQTAALRAFADLAAAGCDMPLTQPSANEIVMEKENLLKTVARAISAEYDRRGYSRMPREGNALTSDAGSEALSLRPWGVIAERAQLLLMSDRYNYLVNGAFEYSGYSWNVSGDGTYAFTTARNRDADDNWMVQCHHRQGISLELSVPPGGRMTVANRRKVSPAWPMTARFRLFARFDGGELPVKAVLGGRESEGIVVCREIPEADRWHEVRFRPVELPAGDHALEIVVSNPGTKPAVVNVDGLDLRLSGAPGR